MTDFRRREALAFIGAAALSPMAARAAGSDPVLTLRAGRIKPNVETDDVTVGARADGGFLVAGAAYGRLTHRAYSPSTTALAPSRTLSLPATIAKVAAPTVFSDNVTMFCFTGALTASPGNVGVFTVQMSAAGQATTPVTRVNASGNERPGPIVAIKRSDRTSLVAWQTQGDDGLQNVRWRIVGRSAIPIGVQTVKRPSGRQSHRLVGLAERPNLAAALAFYRFGAPGQMHLQLINSSGEAEGQIAVGSPDAAIASAADGRIGVLWSETQGGNAALCMRIVGPGGAVSSTVRSVLDDVTVDSVRLAASADGYFVAVSAGQRVRPDGFVDWYERAYAFDPAGRLIQMLNVNVTPDPNDKYLGNRAYAVTRLANGDFLGLYRFHTDPYFQRLRLA